MDYSNTNICALSTPQGSGAIGIIRVSGPDSIEIVDKIFVPVGKQRLVDTPGYKMKFGSIYRGEKLLDEAMVAVFRAPHSYTGENMVEFHCHGGVAISSAVIETCIKNDVKFAFVEQDECYGEDPFECLKRSYDYLRSCGFN
jgi:tRNA modification GTPase